MYGGAYGIGRIDRRNKCLFNQGIIKEICKALIILLATSLLKVTEEGKILYNDLTSETWDIVIGDEFLNELSRREGKGKGPHSFKNIELRSRTCDDNQTVAWIRGSSHLSIVNVKTLKAKHINNFWVYNDLEAYCCEAAHSQINGRIVGIGVLPITPISYTFHIFDGTEHVFIFKDKDILENATGWSGLEICIDSSHFFTSASVKENKAVHLFAISLDGQALIKTHTLFGSEYSLEKIFSMRRHPEGDIVFLGCVGVIAISLWSNEGFYLINKIQTTQFRPVHDMSFYPGMLYFVNGTSVGEALYFDKSLIVGRDLKFKELKSETLQKEGFQSPLKQYYASIKQEILPTLSHNYTTFKVQQINIPGGIDSLF